MFRLWLRMEQEERRRLWWLYGWFAGLMCAGSCVGVFTWSARMQYLYFDFVAVKAAAQALSQEASSNRWHAAFCVSFASETLCLAASKLLVLDRMVDFAVPHGDGARVRLVAAARGVNGVVAVGNATGLIAMIVAAVYNSRAAALYSDASAALAANNTQLAHDFVVSAKENRITGSRAHSVQRFSEVAMLIIIIVAFSAVGALCAHRINVALRMQSRDNSGIDKSSRRLRRQIVSTVCVVFVTFMLRCVYATLAALGDALQNVDVDCGTVSTSPCDPNCYNVYSLINTWDASTPEFQLIIVLISSPVALLVALWGMTSRRMVKMLLRSAGWRVASASRDSRKAGMGMLPKQ